MGVLIGWRFCPRCAAELGTDGRRAECPSCGSVYYAKSAPTASALITDGDGRLLLGRRANEPDAGRWDLLGGFLEEGEHPIDGLRRELREETGLEIDPGEFVGSYVDTYGNEAGATSVLNLVWRARIAPGEAVPADDVSELRWFDLEELPSPDELAFNWVAQFLEDLKQSAAA